MFSPQTNRGILLELDQRYVNIILILGLCQTLKHKKVNQTGTLNFRLVLIRVCFLMHI